MRSFVFHRKGQNGDGGNGKEEGFEWGRGWRRWFSNWLKG